MPVIKERPIIFSAPMVRAIFEGRKTQTRRVIKPRPVRVDRGIPYRHKTYQHDISCPYGEIGDRFWVRETWARVTDYDGNFILSPKRKALYKADCEFQIIPNEWKSPIFMPRWASRITLEITNIRVERIQDITEGDAILEGCKQRDEETGLQLAKSNFEILWDSINFKHGYGWNINPWVWVIEFKRISNADKL